MSAGRLDDSVARDNLGRRILGLVVAHRGLDRVLGEDRAVDLDGRQRELARDLRVLDRQRLVERLALDPLGDQRARRDRRAAAVGLELGVLDQAGFAVDLDLQLHHVATGWCADHAGADGIVALGERADVARILVVLYDFLAVSHGLLPGSGPPQWAAHWMVLMSMPS